MNPWTHRNRYPNMPTGSKRGNIVLLLALVALAIALQWRT